jgi:hypothetical protein
VEVTALQENALNAFVELPRTCRILLLGVLNIHGIRLDANVLFLMNLEEMLML